MKLTRQLLLCALPLMLTGSLPAQIAPGAGDVPGLDEALRLLFAKVDGFTSTTVMTIAGGGQSIKLTAQTSMLNGDSRTDVDLAKMEGAAIPPQVLNQLKSAGMDRVVTIAYARDGSSLMVYPGMKAYAVVAAPRSGPDSSKLPEPKMEKQVLGTEEVQGKPCEKSLVKVSGRQGTDIELTVWTEKAGNQLPLKLATSQGGVDLTMEFVEFKKEKPDAKLFEEPTSYQKHGSVQELMMANMQKLMQAAPGK